MSEKVKSKIRRFGSLLREFRLKRGMSQEVVRIKTGISQETLSRIENSHSKNPRIQTVLLLAETLAVKLDDLFKGDK